MGDSFPEECSAPERDDLPKQRAQTIPNAVVRKIIRAERKLYEEN
jgi:hypothetical protein